MQLASRILRVAILAPLAASVAAGAWPPRPDARERPADRDRPGAASIRGGDRGSPAAT